MIGPGFLSAAARLELEACVRRQRENNGIGRCANAILLLDGKPCQEISDFLYLDDGTICGWYEIYRKVGWKGGQSRMVQAQEAALCAWLEGCFCRSTAENSPHICAEFGLDYPHSGCIAWSCEYSWGCEHRNLRCIFCRILERG